MSSNKFPKAFLNPYMDPPLSGRRDINDYIPPESDLLTTQTGVQLTTQDHVDLTTQGT